MPTEHAPIATHLDEVQEELEEVLARNGIPGAQAALSDGEQIWTFFAGVTDLESRVSVAEHTLFPFASVTKTITSIMAMVLMDDGRLDIDAVPGDYLPGLRLPDGADHPITVADLLCHTSGLHGLYDAEDHETAQELVRRQASELTRFAAPGACFSLSNAAYLIAAACIDRVTGKPWETSVRELVLDRVGAKSTTSDRERVMQSDVSRGHLPNRVGAPLVIPVPFGPKPTDATGGLFGTAHDALAVVNGLRELLSPKALAALEGKRTPIHDCHWRSTSPGWLHSTWNQPVLDTRGADAGQEAIVRTVPATGRSLCLLANSWTRRWPYFDVMPWTSETLLGARMPDDPPTIPLEDSQRYIGVYSGESVDFLVEQGPSGLTLSTRNQGSRGGLFIQLRQVPLDPVAPDRFLFEMDNVQRRMSLGFSSQSGGRAEFLHVLQRTAPRISSSPE